MIDRLWHGARELEFLSQLARATSRRKFLEWSGVTLAVSSWRAETTTTRPVRPVRPAPPTPPRPCPPPWRRGTAVTIAVQAKDADGRNLTAGGADVAATVTGANSAGPIPAVDNGDGTYTLHVHPGQPGHRHDRHHARRRGDRGGAPLPLP